MALEANNKKAEPIPRHLPLQEITLNFTQRTWEEIAPTNLYYLPLSQTVKYMMDPAMLQQFNKFQGLWESMKINNVGFKISNLIMLQDDLRVQNNTPTDATAFTQVVYLMHFVPYSQKQYFKLTNISDTNSLRGETLTLEYKPKNLNTQLAVFNEGYTSFENVGLIPGKTNQSGGITPGIGPVIAADFSVISNYVAPDTPLNPFRAVSGNLQMQDNLTNFVDGANSITFARNQDHIEFLKYGDTMECEINTNLNGVPLINAVANNFTIDSSITYRKGNNLILYNTEWCYPSRHRPFFSKADYLSTGLNSLLHAKQFKPLKHHFFCMPPIKKPNGATLGQRCSFMLEQHFSVTFKMSQAYFDFDTTEMQNQLEQDNGVIIRRNFYGKVSPTSGGDISPFCGKTLKMECADTYFLGGVKRSRKRKLNAPICPLDDWNGLNYAMALVWTDWIAKDLIRIGRVPPDDPGNVGPYNIAYITVTDLQADPAIEEAWYETVSEDGGMLTLRVEPIKVIEGDKTYARYGEFYDGTNSRKLEVIWDDAVSEEYVYVTFMFDNIWTAWTQLFPGITCKPYPPNAPPQNSNYVSESFKTGVFFS